MVNKKKIDGLISNLEFAVTRLRDISQFERAAFLADPVMIGGAKYYLLSAIEACISIGSHIISSQGFRTPKDYRDIFAVLNENGILTSDFASTLQRMAGLRNRLVHLYWEIDDELIYTYLQERLGDFEAFKNIILEYLQKNP